MKLFCQDCGCEIVEFGLFTVPRTICPYCNSNNIQAEPNIFLEVTHKSVNPYLCRKCKIVFYLQKKDEPLLQSNPVPYPFCPVCGRIAASRDNTLQKL